MKKHTHNPYAFKFVELVRELQECKAEWKVGVKLSGYGFYPGPQDQFIVCSWQDPFAFCPKALLRRPVVARVSSQWSGDKDTRKRHFYSDATADTVVEALRLAFDDWAWSKAELCEI